MDYTEGIVRNTEFFTTAELAKKLKMNVQVITRKIQSGEIRAYKIGKDWRIPEQSVYIWLEQQANDGHTGAAKAAVERPKQAQKTEALAGNGQRKHFLEYILAQFEPGRSYAEEEIDRIVERYHHDFRTVRRELISEKMMEAASGRYRRRPGYRLASPQH